MVSYYFRQNILDGCSSTMKFDIVCGYLRLVSMMNLVASFDDLQLLSLSRSKRELNSADFSCEKHDVL